jgi:hypothetical protein
VLRPASLGRFRVLLHARHSSALLTGPCHRSRRPPGR